jgi:hypothetical protein
VPASWLKTTAVAALCGACALAGGLLANRPPRTPPQSSTSVEELSQQVRALEGQVAILGRAVGNLATKGGPSTPPGDPVAPTPTPAAPIAAGASPPTMAATLEARYARAPRDRDGEPAALAEVSRTLARVVPGATVVAGTCTDELCRLVIEHTQPETQTTLAGTLVEEEAVATEAYYVYDQASTPPRTTMYLARPGHTLPRATR